MAGRILNRQARTKILYNLLAVIPTVCSYDGLQGCKAIAETALDAGPDIEKVRDALNARRLIIRDTKRKEQQINDIFSK